MKENELKALVSLLDDTDHEVVQHVEDKILSFGQDIIPFLETQWEQTFNPDIQRKIEDIIHFVQYKQLREKLLKWKESGQEDLLEAMWLISTYHYPDLELRSLEDEVNQLYYEIWTEMRDDLNPYDTIKTFNSAFFGKLRFNANTKNFHSPGNSMINVVLESRKGNPISLCVVYQIVAQMMDLPVYGVNLPNLFVLTYKDDDTQFYINAFNRGLIFSRSDIDSYINQLSLDAKDIFYEPCSNLDIVVRTLRNLLVSFEKLGEQEKVEEIRELLHQLNDGMN